MYWHSEGGLATHEGIRVKSANLIDFFVSLSSESCSLHVVAPDIDSRQTQLLSGSSATEFTNAPRISGSRFISLGGAIQLLYFVAVGTGRSISKDARSSVSVAFSGFGTLVAFRRVFIDKRSHSFIIRGNRLKTVRTSSRPFVSKTFALFRIRIYLWILVRAVRTGRAQVWFQGGEYKRILEGMVPSEFHSKLFLLDAVLRDLPNQEKVDRKRKDIVYLGRLTVEKGLVELIEGVATLKNKGMIVSVVIVGEGPDRALLETAVRQAQLEKQVEFVGFVSDKHLISKYLLDAKVFVLPSYTEGLPRSVLEAAALGVPIVCTPVGGLPLVFSHMENLYFIDVASSKSIVGAVEYVLSNDNSEHVQEMVRRAQKLAVKHSFKERGKYFLSQIESC